MRNKIWNEIRKIIVNIAFIALFVFLILLIFQDQTEFIYDFKTQNYLMIALITLVCLKYYRNYYRFAAHIFFILLGMCSGINLIGWLITGKYRFVGILALWDNYRTTLIVSVVAFLVSLVVFFAIKLFKSEKKGISEYCEEIMADKILYDSHKYDAEYVCKFIFESRLRTLGVTGRYGMGKTVIMDKIIDITSSIRNIYVTISPLSCNIEEMPTYIIGQIEKALKEKGIYCNNTRQIINTTQNGYLQSLFNFIDGNQELSELYKNVKELISGLDIRLTIVVDDLERIYDKKQIQAIFIILDSIISDNCKVIYLYDALILNRIFKEEGGSKYIEKYIQDEYLLKKQTFRELIRIENFNYIEHNKNSNNENICEMINDEVDNIVFRTKIYKYSDDGLQFDEYKLTPRVVNKIVQMTYERLSDINYVESIKGYERLVFRFYVFTYYFNDFKQQIVGKNNPSLYFTFKHNDKEITLEQVLGKFFNVGEYPLGEFTKEEQFKEYTDFVHTEDNAKKMLALDLLGYNINYFKSYLEHRNIIDVAESDATQNEVVYNRLYVNLSYDEIYNSNMFYNTKVASIIANLVNMSNSEYTNHERFIKDFREKVLNKKDKLEALKNYKFEKYKNNRQTTFVAGQDKFTSIFNSFKSGNAEDIYWNDLMELYYKYLIKDDKIVFNDVVLTNINLFGFVSYRASIYAFMIISKFIFEDCENKFIDIPSIPQVMILIKEFLENNFGVRTIFHYPEIEKYYKSDDISECKKSLLVLKDYLPRFIKRLDDINEILKNKFKKDLSYIRVAIEKIIELIDNASKYKDSIDRVYMQTTVSSLPRDISKYKGKSKEEIDKMFDDDLDNGVLIPTDYKRIMEQFNRENEEGQNDNL